MEDKKELPARKLTLKINDNSYVVNFLTNKQFIEIQDMKALLSKGQYSVLSLSADPDDFQAKRYIDMVSYFTVLIPALKKDLNVPSLLDLDLIMTQELLHDVFEEQFIPWFNEWMEVLNTMSNAYYDKKEKSA